MKILLIIAFVSTSIVTLLLLKLLVSKEDELESEETSTPPPVYKEHYTDDKHLDLTGLSVRAKKAIVDTGCIKESDLDLGILGYLLKNTKGVGPKTIAEINAWSEANYNITAIV